MHAPVGPLAVWPAGTRYTLQYLLSDREERRGSFRCQCGR
jgi:hypothetical protein